MAGKESVAIGQGRFDNNLSTDLRLRGSLVELVPMALSHTDGLIKAASSGELWNLPYAGVPAPHQMSSVVEGAIEQGKLGVEFPFVVRLVGSGEIVGSTRYYLIQPEHRNLSIGYTWYAQHVQRTGVNTQCKYLLLKHAFEVLNCISVQWHTDHRNKRSQAAIKRIGAKFEGVLRNHRIMPDGVIRHTHCFSLLNTEWPDTKAFLESSMARTESGAK